MENINDHRLFFYKLFFNIFNLIHHFSNSFLLFVKKNDKKRDDGGCSPSSSGLKGGVGGTYVFI
jgi:hypothetical protein